MLTQRSVRSNCRAASWGARVNKTDVAGRYKDHDAQRREKIARRRRRGYGLLRHHDQGEEPALAKLLNGGAVQDVVVFGGGDVQASLGQDVSDTQRRLLDRLLPSRRGPAPRTPRPRCILRSQHGRTALSRHTGLQRGRQPGTLLAEIDDGLGRRRAPTRSCSSTTAPPTTPSPSCCGWPPGTQPYASSSCGATSARRPPSRMDSPTCRGDIVVTLDGDLQDDPAEIPQLLAKLEEGYDLVSGWKQQPPGPGLPRRCRRACSTGPCARPPGCGCTTSTAASRPIGARSSRTISVYGELHRYIPVVASQAGVPRRRDQGRAPAACLGALQVRLAAVPARLPRPAHGALPGPLSASAPAPVRRHRHAHDPRRRGRRRLSRDLKMFGHAIGQRPLLLLGTLLIIVGIQSLSLGLLERADRLRTGARQRRDLPGGEDCRRRRRPGCAGGAFRGSRRAGGRGRGAGAEPPHAAGTGA